MSNARLDISPLNTPVAAGGQSSLTATITNLDPTPQLLQLSVRGLNQQWLTLIPPLLELGPQATGTSTVLIQPPLDAQTVNAMLVVSLVSAQDGSVLVEEAVPLAIQGVAPTAIVSGTPANPTAPMPATTRASRIGTGNAGFNPPRWLWGVIPLVLVLLLLGGIYVLAFRGRDQVVADDTIIPTVSAVTADAVSPLSCAADSATQRVSLLSDDRTTAIMMSNPDLSGLRILRTEPGERLPGLFDALLSLSPDGSHLAYVTADNPLMDEARLWYVDVTDPGRSIELAYVPDGFWPVRPAWSPDNQRVAFVRLDPKMASRQETRLELWVADVGEQPTRIGSLEDLQPETFYGNRDVPLCWAVDNQTVIFKSLLPPTDGRDWQTEVNVDAREAHAIPRAGQATPTAQPATTATSGATGGTECGVPIFSQNDPAWSYLIMSAAGDSIGGFGCALSSAAMLLNYYGASLTPAELNACLGDWADPLYWAQAPPCTNGVVGGGEQFDFSWEKLDDVLASGHPAIVGMIRGQTGMHFVVITSGGGGNGANYTVTDPWDGSTDKTLQYFFNTGYNPRWIVTYDGPGRNCTRVASDGGTAPPPLDGVSDGGVYRDPVTVDVTSDDGSDTSITVVDVTLADEGEDSEIVTPTAESTPQGTPGGPAATPDLTTPVAPPGPGGWVSIIDRPLLGTNISAGTVLYEEGVYLLIVLRQRDGQDPAVQTIKITIDRTAPMVEIADAAPPAASQGQPSRQAALTSDVFSLQQDVSGIATANHTGSANFQIMAQDILSGVALIEYRVDGTEWRPYSNDTSFKHILRVTDIGEHRLGFRATDLAGNQSDEQTFTFRVLPPGAGTPSTGSPTISATPQATPTIAPTATPQPTTVATLAPTQPPEEPAIVEVDPLDVEFTTVGTTITDPQTITIYNDGDTDLRVRSLTLGGSFPGEFVIFADDCSGRRVEGGDLCTIEVRYRPTITANTTTTFDAALTIVSNAEDSPHIVALHGTQVPSTPVPTPDPVKALEFKPDKADFGEEDGEVLDKVLTFAAVSSGDTAVTIERVVIEIEADDGQQPQESKDFVITNDFCSKAKLAPGETCRVQVRFEPMTSGERTADLVFYSDADGAPDRLPLKGVGTGTIGLVE